MAVKNILNFVDCILDRLSNELNELSLQAVKFSEFIKENEYAVSDSGPEVIRMLKQKHGPNPKELKTYRQLAEKELAEIPGKLSAKQSKMSFWENIKEHIIASEDGYFHGELAEALKEIEAVPSIVVGMFGMKTTTAFGKTLLKDENKNKAIITKLKQLKANGALPMLDPEFAKELQWMHEQLMKVYQFGLMDKNVNEAWEYSFPTKKTHAQTFTHPLESDVPQDTGRIETPSLLKWQEDLKEVARPGKALGEVNRGFGMPGLMQTQLPITQEVFKSILRDTLKKTTYSAEEQTSIEAWIDANLTQMLNRFPDYMMDHGDFLKSNADIKATKSEEAPYQFAKITTLDFCLFIEDGKIFFGYDVLIQTIDSLSVTKYNVVADEITRNELSALEKNAGRLSNRLDELNKQGKLLPLARIKARAPIEVIDNQVVINMQDLFTKSYTDFLQNPESIYGTGKEIQIPRETNSLQMKNR